MSDMKNKFENFVNKTKEFAGKVKDGIVKNAQKFNEKLKPCLTKTKEVFSGVMSKVKETASKTINNTKDHFARFSVKDLELASRENKFENFVNKTKEFAGKVKDGVVKNAQKFGEKLKPYLAKTKEVFSGAMNKVKETATKFANSAKEHFAHLPNKDLKLGTRETSSKESSSPTPKKSIPKKPSTIGNEQHFSNAEPEKLHLPSSVKNEKNVISSKKLLPKKINTKPYLPSTRLKKYNISMNNDIIDAEYTEHNYVSKLDRFVNKTKEFAKRVKDGIVKNTQKFKEKLKPCVAKTKEVFSGAMNKVKETASKTINNTKDHFARFSGKNVKLGARETSSKNKNGFNVPDYDKIFGLTTSYGEKKDNTKLVQDNEPIMIELENFNEKEQIDNEVDNHYTQSADNDKVEKVETELLDSNEYKKFNDTDVDYADSNEEKDIIDAESTDVKDQIEEPTEETPNTETINEKENLKDTEHTVEPKTNEDEKSDDTAMQHKLANTAGLSATDKFDSTGTTGLPPKDKEPPKTEADTKIATNAERLAQAYVLVAYGGKSMDQAMEVIGKTTYDELDKFLGADGSIQTAKNIVAGNETLLAGNDKYKVVMDMVDTIRRNRIKYNTILDKNSIAQNLPTGLVGPDEISKDLLFLAPFLEEKGLNIGTMSKSPNGQFVPSKEMQDAIFAYTNNYKDEHKIKTLDDLEHHIVDVANTYAPLQGSESGKEKIRDMISESSKDLARTVAQNNRSNGYGDICDEIAKKDKPKETKPREPFELNIWGSLAKSLSYVLFAGALFGANPILLFLALFLMGAKEVFPPTKFDPNKGLTKLWFKIWDKLSNTKEHAKDKDKKLWFKIWDKLSNIKEHAKDKDKILAKVNKKLAKNNKKKDSVVLSPEESTRLCELKEKDYKKLSKNEKKELKILEKRDNRYNKLVNKENKLTDNNSSSASGEPAYDILANREIEEQNNKFSAEKMKYQDKIKANITEAEGIIKMIEDGKLSGYDEKDISALKNEIKNMRSCYHEVDMLKNPENTNNDIIKKELELNPLNKNSYNKIAKDINFTDVFNKKINELGINAETPIFSKITNKNNTLEEKNKTNPESSDDFKL